MVVYLEFRSVISVVIIIVNIIIMHLLTIFMNIIHHSSPFRSA